VLLLTTNSFKNRQLDFPIDMETSKHYFKTTPTFSPRWIPTIIKATLFSLSPHFHSSQPRSYFDIKTYKLLLIKYEKKKTTYKLVFTVIIFKTDLKKKKKKKNI
jgi:hypothetical protein